MEKGRVLRILSQMVWKDLIGVDTNQIQELCMPNIIYIANKYYNIKQLYTVMKY